MKPGQGSQTAVLVCVARAIAHERAIAPGFSDPTALALLPAAGRTQVEQFRAPPPSGIGARLLHEATLARAAITAVRTLFVDEAVREAHPSQVVILGAGLDGRAWRMPELRQAVVFEVDHPDSQSDKRSRLSALSQVAREVRFVPVDFTRDDLVERLAAAGHDRRIPTTWVWEGVVMYLTPAQVGATLAKVQALSAPDSRLIIVYHGPGGLVLRIVGLVVRRMGEPLRSNFDRAAMASLLQRHGFTAIRDEDMHEAAVRLAPAAEKPARRSRHLRLVSAAVRG